MNNPSRTDSSIVVAATITAIASTATTNARRRAMFLSFTEYLCSEAATTWRACQQTQRPSLHREPYATAARRWGRIAQCLNRGLRVEHRSEKVDRRSNSRPDADVVRCDKNGPMPDAAPWSRVRSELYALIGRNPRSNRRLVSIAALEPSHVVLDIGCGPGAAVRAAAPQVTRAVGIDRSEPMIEIARRRSRKLTNAEFSLGGAEDLPFPADSFDRVWSIHAFHHWEDQAQGLAESLRVLKPGGRLLIVESDTSGSHGLDRDGADDLAARLRSVGFAGSSVSKPYRELVVTGVSGP